MKYHYGAVVEYQHGKSTVLGEKSVQETVHFEVTTYIYLGYTLQRSLTLFQTTGCTKCFSFHWQESFVFCILSFSFYRLSFTPFFPLNEMAWFSHNEECHVPQLWWFMKLRLGHGVEMNNTG